MAGEGDKYRYESREYLVCSWQECNIYNSATSHMAGEGNKYRYETREYRACSWREYNIYISTTSHMAGEDDKYRHETRVYPACSWREYHIYNPATNSRRQWDAIRLSEIRRQWIVPTARATTTDPLSMAA